MAELGFKIDARPSEDVIALSRMVESHGFEQLWFCEDLGLAGGVAQVAAALAVTARVQVGLGIAPAAVRNPMYLAMEFASLARLSGGRLRAGIGHGMPRWLDRVGQHPGSLMTCLAEVSETVNDLLAGLQVTFDGEYVHLDAVSLNHPPLTAPPLSLGVRGPKGIALAKELGLGVILAEGSPPDYVSRVRRFLGAHLPITVFTWCGVDIDDAAGFASVRPTIEAALHKPHLANQLGDLLGKPVDEHVIRRLSVSGHPRTCVDSIRRLADSGADHIVLQPVDGREEEQIALFGGHVIPNLTVSAAAQPL